MLHLHRATGEISDRKFRDCVELLEAGDLLVINETRVTALRLMGRKSSGGIVEALLLSGTAPRYRCLIKPGRRLHVGATVYFDDLRATIVGEYEDGQREIEFEPSADLVQRLNELGQVPLPPYIRTRLEDRERYQTTYAARAGSAAAPTAGLHFTTEILEELARRGVELARVSLDVGLDTFRPVQSEDLSHHQMHGERCRVPEETAEKVAKCRGRIVAVGTTTVRTLETMATGPRSVKPGETTSQLFIRPGFRFQIVDGMFTNFHLPRTTMLMMISALTTYDSVRDAYRHAVRERYRFLSFGDAMLIL